MFNIIWYYYLCCVIVLYVIKEFDVIVILFSLLVLIVDLLNIYVYMYFINWLRLWFYERLFFFFWVSEYLLDFFVFVFLK